MQLVAGRAARFRPCDFERLRQGWATIAACSRWPGWSGKGPAPPPPRPRRRLIDARLASFKLGQRDHDALFPPSDWTEFRRKTDDAIEALRN